MRLCVPVVCFFGKSDFTDAIKRIAELGYDAIETYNWKNLDFDKVKSACNNYGVEFVSMCTTQFNMTNPDLRKVWLDGLIESCAAANKLGVRRLITQVGADTGKERAFQHQSILDALKLAKPVLEDSGVTLMLEPLNTLVNHPGYYLTTAKEGFDIVREADSPCIKLVYDIYHQQITEGNIIPSIVNNLDCIAHLHSAGHPGRHELQKGENNYHYIFEQVDKAGYKGCCGLEYNPTYDAEQSLLDAIKTYGNYRV